MNAGDTAGLVDVMKLKAVFRMYLMGFRDSQLSHVRTLETTAAVAVKVLLELSI